ncbi:ABC transporter related protein [Isosphaera pallida ATCC 43644]|jgi:ABC-type multidrug transport system fused ATPase/permease subunit|uniref:ABC transporter related protein n=1 Tax=Isosphaera pallida (strain ATCC 43644 / DSM 9630 / IS1B) TaxID=575540 RepID=E8QYG6_ISOPI|nr:ABC transporter ATP-binding protein [Isosphaera pallida]ADV64149.1 ABC transporter related protein [Isosphaera pallida ATCC 43644]
MTNFFRLIGLARAYRGRFLVSLVCAGFVALLWSANIGLVYPLLNILFHNGNCQIWVADQIASARVEIASLEARIEEVDALADWNAQGRDPEAFRKRFDAIDEEALHLRGEQRRAERERAALIAAEPLAPHAVAANVRVAEGRLLSARLAIVEARLDELKRHVDSVVKQGQGEILERRRQVLKRDLDSAQTWLNRYLVIQPYVNRYLPNDGFQTLLILIGLLMLGVAVKGVFQFFQDYLVASVTHLTLFRLRNQFFRRTMALDLKHFNEQGTADLIARFTNDVEMVGVGLNLVMGRLIREPLRAMSCLGAAMWLNWRLTVFALILVPLSLYCTVRVGKILKKAVRRSLESLSEIYKILQETFQGIKVVKASSMERHERNRFHRETKTLLRKSIRVATIDAVSDPVLELLALGTVSIALLSGAYLVLRQTIFLDFGFASLQLAARPMAIEDLLSLYAMLAGISDPIRKLANVHSKIQRAAAASDRICALMDRRPEVVDKPNAVVLPRHQRSIEFTDVVFAYPGREPILKGLTLQVRHGERIALVGANGSGKSTLMALLARFHDVQEGAIRVDGVDLRDAVAREWRRQIGMVTQETVLFEGTIAANIAYGKPHASRAEIEEAAKRAYAHNFIEQLPQGYETRVAEAGHSLSGGQRQRIALARVMLRDPSVLILDEATSAIDIEDETLIRKALEVYSRGRTTFLIAHHLGTIQSADRIALLDGGKVVAVGTHQELRRESPLYRRLTEAYLQMVG